MSLSIEQTQKSQDSSSVTPLRYPPGSVFFSRVDQRAIASRFARVFLALQPRHGHDGFYLFHSGAGACMPWAPSQHKVAGWRLADGCLVEADAASGNSPFLWDGRL